MYSDQGYSSVFVNWTKQECLQTRLKWWQWWGTSDIIWNRVPDRRRSKRKWTITKCCLTVCRSIEKRHGVWAGASVQWLFMQHVSDIWHMWTIGVVVRMSILYTKVAGSNLSINMFSPWARDFIRIASVDSAVKWVPGGDNLMKGVQCYELFGGIALKITHFHMMVQYCCDSGSTNKLFCKCFLLWQEANEVILNVWLF